MTGSDLVSEEHSDGRHPLVESYPMERCEDVEDYNKRGTLDSLYLAKSKAKCSKLNSVQAMNQF